MEARESAGSEICAGSHSFVRRVNDSAPENHKPSGSSSRAGSRSIVLCAKPASNSHHESAGSRSSDRQDTTKSSLICTGSHLNRRVFPADDPWLSVESTILSGNVTYGSEELNANSNQQPKLLPTVDEEKDHCLYSSVELEPIEDDNVLNMNIDAISDDEVFFDCATSPCPTPRKFKTSNTIKSPRRKLKIEPPPQQQFGQFLVVEDCLSAEVGDYSSSVEVDQRTGGFLVQLVDDFNDMKDHAQSTPKLDETDSGYFQLPMKAENVTPDSGVNSECVKSPKPRPPAVPPKKKIRGSKSPSSEPRSLVDPSNKENYYRGKYSGVVARKPRGTPQRPRRVALMTQFFESRIMSESQSVVVKKQPSTSSIYYKTTLRRSPKSNDLRSLSSNVTSHKKRLAHSRPSSCSEFSNTESTSSFTSHRSKSTSDVLTDSSNERKKFKHVVIRRYKFNSQRTTLHVNSPKDSTIKKRRSLGLVVSPIKPVRELRKKFSPRYREIKAETSKSFKKTLPIICINKK